MLEKHVRYAAEIDLSGSQITTLMRDVLARGGVFRFQARGASMSPFIRDGDVISIVPLAGRAPRLGAVVAYLRPLDSATGSARLIVHRVVKKSGQGCVILGDNQAARDADGPVAPENILGAVVCIERMGKKVRFGLGPEGMAIALAARAGLLRPAIRAAAALRAPFKKLLWLGRRTR